MTWWDEVRDACLAEQSACDATGGTPFDAWPVLLPIAAVVATVGLGIRVVVLMREGGETEGVARSVSDPPREPGGGGTGRFRRPG